MRIVYHDTQSEKGRRRARAERKGIADAGLPTQKGGTQVLFPRTKTKIPHNKFIVRMKDNTEPVAVWTGSTNFTPSGFLGQTNVGHWVEDADTAKQYLDYWTAADEGSGTGRPASGRAQADARTRWR